MRKYAINGRFVVRNLTGQERFARETFAELDKIIKPGWLEIVVPQYAEENKIPQYKNIKIVKWGHVKSHLWEQIDFFWYLILHGRTGINPCTTCPLLKPDINTLHDINQNVNPQFFTSRYGKLSTVWHTLMIYASFWFGKKVLTVSRFSKSEMVRVLKVNPDKIAVLGNGWQHVNRITPDDSIFDRYEQLKKGEYYFAASSLTPQKNFIWVINAAKKNPNAVFAIAGKKEKLTELLTDGVPGNLLFLGYVTDEEMKSLMQNCKAFIHPALYEGFGIPPIEAMANGAPLIIAKASCLPEIFRNSVHYIDPYNSDVNIDALLKESVEASEKVLNEYSWEKNAKELLEILKKI